ncbi:esterase, putative [Talaromyces stipitatus ATCC 10500]|uniref:Esterase, putative n=1 Tax=Talaromyces stipitatus (strain ATCC 10500 / CBS 375.48 / QM 6759 / NRRL 1006) TaxID=441959 RepID=B8LZV6_TALSN|nr:esterase, putative [Talaromyces stipitatus ATCC 10500]EED20888.1 esterase, putative [Talaromyces stipitatus ATCC 10500]
MATLQLPGDIQASLRRLLDNTTSSTKDPVAGLVYCAVNRDGDLIFNHASGSRSYSSPSKTENNPMTLDTIFWMASCTKMITGIACMQLVEQGKLALDDVEMVGRIAPELKAVKVLEGDLQTGFRLIEKQRGITLRMLLTHTAGFGYPFNNARLRDYTQNSNCIEFGGDRKGLVSLPLVNQPGVKYEYGINIDWAGILVERVSNASLDEYFQKYIFQPLGIRDIGFFPNEEMKTRLVSMHRREPDGSLHVVGHVYQFPLSERKNPEMPEDRFCSGGGGCFGTMVDYCKIIAALLNNGIYAKTNTPILKPDTVDEMYKDHIPHCPRRPNLPSQTISPLITKSNPLRPLANPVEDEKKTEGYGLTFALSHQAKNTGRKSGSASWSGLPNLYWFADRETGVGAIIGSQIMPHGDTPVLDVNDEVEKLLYMGLKRT